MRAIFPGEDGLFLMLILVFFQKKLHIPYGLTVNKVFYLFNLLQFAGGMVKIAEEAV